MGQINLKTRQQRIAYKEDNKDYFLTSPEQYSKIDVDPGFPDTCTE